MHTRTIERWKHDHRFHGDTGRAERNTRRVVLITFVMMAAEVVAGTLYGSMALLADGWHMGTHAAALGVTAFAYRFAQRHADDPRFSFGTGKVGVLGGFAGAVGLAVVALFVALESIERFFAPVSIRFNQAILVAGIGLAVNVFCALLLWDKGHHPHDHDHDHDHGHEDRHPHDHNLRAAYYHVLADATTSVCAIAALTAGKMLGWVWMDPGMGIVGSVIIARWSWTLVRDTSRILLDGGVDPGTVAAIRSAVEADADNRVSDLHVWRVGSEHLAAVVSIVTHDPRPPEHYKRLLAEFDSLAHVTVEVNPCPGDDEVNVPPGEDGRKVA